MKITKSILKQIIKEELESVVQKNEMTELVDKRRAEAARRAREAEREARSDAEQGIYAPLKHTGATDANTRIEAKLDQVLEAVNQLLARS